MSLSPPSSPRVLSVVSSFKLLSPEKYEEWVKYDFGLLGAYCYPEADDERLKLCIDYLIALFAYDDLMDVPGDDDSTQFMHNRHGADKASQLLMYVFKKPEDFKPIPGLPVISTYHE